MKCPNCQHEQSTGKFCGKCGTTLMANAGEMSANSAHDAQQPTAQFTASPQGTAAPVYQAPTEPNQHVEKVKATSKQYWNYYLQYIKKPGSIVEQANGQFVNALITLGLFALIFTLAIYKNLGAVLAPVDQFGGMFGASESIMPSFISVLLTTAFSMAVFFGLAAGCIYLVNKFAGPDESFKTIVTYFGTLAVPSVALALTSYVLILMNSMVFGNILLIISLSLTLSLMPLYLITVLLKKTMKSFDSFYAYLSYTVLFSVSSAIVMVVFFDSTIGRYIEDLEELFYLY